MTDNPQLALTLPETAQTPRRGRPRGSGNKRSHDLARYVAHRFAGMTPGQQAAELCMVTTRELREARARAREVGVPPMLIAMARKANVLAGSLGCDPRDAMAILIKAQSELLPYVHQKLAPKDNASNAPAATVFMVPDGDSQALPAIPALSDEVEDQAIEFIAVDPRAAGQVSQAMSHDHGQAVDLEGKPSSPAAD